MGVNRDSTNKDVLLGCLFNPWSVCLILGIVIGALVELVQDDTWEVIKRGGEGRVEMPIPGLYVNLYRWELEEELGVQVTPGAELETLLNGRIRLHFIAAEMPDHEEPVPREHQQFFWVELTPEPPETLLPADHEFWKRLAAANKIY